MARLAIGRVFGLHTLFYQKPRNAYSYVGNNPLRFVDPNGEELIALGQREDDIEKRLKDIKQDLKKKDLSETDRESLNKEHGTLVKKLEGTRVVNKWLGQLDRVNERNGLQLSDFTLTTDFQHDFQNAQAVIVDDMSDANLFYRKELGDTIYVIARDDIKSEYQQTLSNPIYAMYGGSGAVHDQAHKLGGGEREAYARQLDVFDKFRKYIPPIPYELFHTWIDAGFKEWNAH
jgi:hypothetical protein